MSKGKGKEATLDRSVDEEQLYYDVTRDWPKGRVYGLRSLGSRKRGYGNPCASTMVRHTQFDVVVQMLAQFAAFVRCQLGMRMDFKVSTSQAPPPRSITSRLGWIQLIRQSSNTIIIGTSRIGWMRSTLVTNLATQARASGRAKVNLLLVFLNAIDTIGDERLGFGGHAAEGVFVVVVEAEAEDGEVGREVGGEGVEEKVGLEAGKAVEEGEEV
ncbi:hypothetical protein Syun_000785 [Stephania yunnanensis]|uniref:Uncharacterized protein n=1 Tax=Stephania yunnanensis TaxID=152371 RepID=A0AAP0LFF5_9MAGN